MKKLNLALLSGGISSEREVSLNSGEQVFAALDKEKYEITHYDPKSDLEKLVRDAKKIDAALIILHGPLARTVPYRDSWNFSTSPTRDRGLWGVPWP